MQKGRRKQWFLAILLKKIQYELLSHIFMCSIHHIFYTVISMCEPYLYGLREVAHIEFIKEKKELLSFSVVYHSPNTIDIST